MADARCDFVTEPPDPFVCPKDSVISDQTTCPCDFFVDVDEANQTTSIGQCDFTFPSTVPVKRLLNGATQSPWIKIAFQKYCTKHCVGSEGCTTINARSPKATTETVITTGNISQPGNEELCHASIKAFQYGWGAVDAGNRCKITIVDEKGGSFEQWVPRLIKNIEGATKAVEGIYQMKVQFGWFITGGDEDDLCGQPFVPPGETPGAGQNSSRLICSKVLWFIPDMINVNYQGNKFIYELEGVDTLVRGQEHLIVKVFGGDGSDNEPRYFTDAVTELARISFPPFRVEFLQNDPVTGAVKPMRFRKREGMESIDDECKGPFQKWVAYERSPLAIIHHWLKQAVLAEGGKEDTGLGITMNYDSNFDCQNGGTVFDRTAGVTVDVPIFGPIAFTPCTISDEKPCECDPDGLIPDVGRLILWGNGFPACQGAFSEFESDSRMKAVYIVNGGNCSPVYAFNPSIKWHFFTALRAGGVSSSTDGRNSKQIDGQVNSKCATHGGRGGARVELTPDTNASDAGVQNVKKEVQTAVIKHNQANLFAHSIEAELRIQGDPSDFYISPVFGYGRAVGIVFVNPYFLQLDDEASVNGCPVWNNLVNEEDGSLTQSVCNTMLTNKGWFIKGVDHQIKEGSYVTTVKVILPAPGAELDDAENAAFVPLGAWIKGLQLKLGGLWTCLGATPLGALATAWAEATVDCIVGAVFEGAGAVCDGGTPVPDPNDP